MLPDTDKIQELEIDHLGVLLFCELNCFLGRHLSISSFLLIILYYSVCKMGIALTFTSLAKPCVSRKNNPGGRPISPPLPSLLSLSLRPRRQRGQRPSRRLSFRSWRPRL